MAAVDGALAKALVLRAHVDEDAASEVLQDLYAAHPENEQVEQALTDTSFGIVTTTAARIEARTDPWDPETEPSAEDFVDPAAHERKAVLLHEAERQLAEFIGLEEVKNQVSRLKSSVAMELVRKQRGLAVAQRAHHLVFAGPPGTGKTTIARVVAKIYCGLGLLKRENIREVHRADLIGQHIGETEAKTNAIIDSALDGVLFLDEAYALVATGAKNDFGLVAIDTLLARMENDRDRLVVIIAGYRADLDKFLTPTRACVPDSPATSTSLPTHRRNWSRSRTRWPSSATAFSKRPRSTTWRSCSRSWRPSRHPTPTGFRDATWTSPVTVDSCETSSNAPKKNESSGSTIRNTPEPANSVTRS